METKKVLFTRKFSGFGALQEAHILQYALTRDTESTVQYGVSVTELRADGENTQAFGALCHSMHAACRLLTYLFENAVEPQMVPGVIDDIRSANLLSNVDDIG